MVLVASKGKDQRRSTAVGRLWWSRSRAGGIVHGPCGQQRKRPEEIHSRGASLVVPVPGWWDRPWSLWPAKEKTRGDPQPWGVSGGPGPGLVGSSMVLVASKGKDQRRSTAVGRL